MTVKTGSIGLSAESLEQLKNYVSMKGKTTEDRPFSSIADGFLFCFCLGLKNGLALQESSTANVSARGLQLSDFIDVVSPYLQEDQAIGSIMSQFAEGGLELMKNQMKRGKHILDLISIDSQ